MTRVALLGTPANETNVELVAAWRAQGIDCELVAPADAPRCLDHDATIARLDVLPTLDGVEPGLLRLLWLERRGLRILNTTRALLQTHDKLRTAAVLRRAGIPHPSTWHVRLGAPAPAPPFPVVLKPRFGSWGRDVWLCTTAGELSRLLQELAPRPWFRRHGVLLQEAVPSPGFDLRVLVAGGRIAGAVERHASPGEWRTNVSLGATRRPALPDAGAAELAIAAAAAVGADLVGVDLLPVAAGRYCVVELNGAVDFDEDYCQDGDVYANVAAALRLARARRRKEETCLTLG
jgi:[lysine-biosynthesis-protein LysW]--L-2-aminoadipate ligase